MGGKSKKYKNAGFTLVELLLAIFIFAIVISSVYGAYRATFHIVDGSKYQLELSHKARSALERISEDLSSIVTAPGGFLRSEEQDFSGARGDALSFISSVHLVLSKKDTLAGNAIIEYLAVPDDDKGTIALYRSDTVILPGKEVVTAKEPRKYLLCDGLQEVRYTFIDEDGNETSEWLSDNDLPEEQAKEADTKLPSIIYVELIFPGASGEDGGSIFKTAVAFPRGPEV